MMGLMRNRFARRIARPAGWVLGLCLISVLSACKVGPDYVRPIAEVGVTFTKQQKKQIETMMKAGKTAKAQKAEQEMALKREKHQMDMEKTVTELQAKMKELDAKLQAQAEKMRRRGWKS